MNNFLPRATRRLVRLPYFVYQVQVSLYPYMFLLLIISQVLCTWATLLCKEHLGNICDELGYVFQSLRSCVIQISISQCLCVILLLIMSLVLCTWAPLLCKEHLGNIGDELGYDSQSLRSCVTQISISQCLCVILLLILSPVLCTWSTISCKE